VEGTEGEGGERGLCCVCVSVSAFSVCEKRRGKCLNDSHIQIHTYIHSLITDQCGGVHLQAAGRCAHERGQGPEDEFDRFACLDEDDVCI